MTTERLDALAAPDGQAVLAELAALDAAELTGPAGLRLGAQLRARYPTELVVDAFGQAELRAAARAKFARADAMWFTRAGLEQASTEVVAQHRRTRFAGAGAVADLCCGIGGDLLALAADHDVRAVDRDPVHLWMAARNAAAHGLGHRVTTVEADVREVDLTGVDAVFVDPARRAGGRRHRVGESEPPLAWCAALVERVGAVGVKAAPGIDHDLAPPGWEIEFVSVGRELKEAALWSPALAGSRTRATVLPSGAVLQPAPGDAVPVRAPGGYLLDPDPAVTRAGLVAELARATGTWQLDGQIAFLSGDEPVQTPFARTLRVLDSAPWHQKRLPQRLRDLDVGAVDIRRRGLAGDVDALHRTLQRSLTGTRRVTLVMTRLDDRPWALVCSDL
ncbi:class I SAM-dependent methyltransferase [Pseudonocardia sp. CA-107938]|uniref:class I SAM-dependent methyltransferase n=1 Tax=Pseudonocardia sp. CA-107938 TaxID=3240021 RepID=UPI003D89E633